MGFERVEGGWRYIFGGMKTNTAADKMPPTKYPYAKNVRKVKSLQTRPGYEILFGTSLEIDTICPLPQGEVGVPYSITFTGTGGSTPYTWTIVSGTLPGGLSLAANGVLSGTPTTNETQVFVVKMTDALGHSVTKSCSLHIAAALAITTVCPLADGQVGVAYDVQLTYSGGVDPVVWTITSGALPDGLTMDGACHITGTPTTNQVSTFTIHIQDSLGATDSKSCQITIQPPCFNFSDDFNRADGALGTPWSWLSESSGHQADIVSQQLACSALGTAEITTAPDTNTTGYAIITWTAKNSRDYGGPMVLRQTSGINNNRYVILAADSGPGTALALVIGKVFAGAFSVLATTGFIYAADGSTLINKPLKLEFDVQASKTVLTAYLNGVQILTVDETVNRITTGRPGFGMTFVGSSTVNTFDNFSCHTCP